MTATLFPFIVFWLALNDTESIGAGVAAAHDGCSCIVGVSCGQIGSHSEVAAAAAVIVIGHDPSEHVRNTE